MDVSQRPAPSEPSDQVLAARVRQDGDEGAFRTLYRRHTAGLYQFVLRVLAGNELEAEDVVQDTWVRAVEKLGQFRWESTLRTWLTGIALNRCREAFRRQDRKWMEISDDLGLVADDPRKHERIDLETALTRLPPGYRMVVLLHDVEGYTHQQIAARLKVSANTSKSQLFRARRMLRSLLAAGSQEARIER